MQLWQAVILGLVEGVTEYLPVSSTGHLILAASLMRLNESAAARAVDSYTIVIQGGAILAVAGLYARSVWRMLLGLLGRDAAGRALLLRLLVAFAPAALLGPLLEETIERWLFRPGPVLAALFLGGVWMALMGRGWSRRQAAAQGQEEAATTEALAELPWRTALGIGLLQTLAMWPGASRSMMTIAGGVLLGLSPKRAAEFSFLLGLPTLGGATVYKLAKDAMGSEASMFAQLGALESAAGLVVATVAAALAVRWLVAFLTRHGLALFGWYRMALAAALAGLWLAGVVQFS